MKPREIALCGMFLALAGVVHFLLRFTVAFTGGIQMAVSIAVYCLIGLLVPMTLAEASFVGVVNGIVLMVATASPFPLANIPSHYSGLVSAKLLADLFKARTQKLSPLKVSIIVAIATTFSLFLFVIPAYYGILSLSSFANTAVPVVKGILAGQVTFWAYLSSSLMLIYVPTVIANIILSPILYEAARPALIRYGFISKPETT